LEKQIPKNSKRAPSEETEPGKELLSPPFKANTAKKTGITTQKALSRFQNAGEKKRGGTEAERMPGKNDTAPSPVVSKRKFFRHLLGGD